MGRKVTIIILDEARLELKQENVQYFDGEAAHYRLQMDVGVVEEHDGHRVVRAMLHNTISRVRVEATEALSERYLGLGVATILTRIHFLVLFADHL